MAQDTAAVLLAAGSGRRLGGVAKALVSLGGRPLLSWSLDALRAAPSVGQIVLVAHAEFEAELRARWQAEASALGADLVVVGGAERWLSCRAGVEACDPRHEIVIVHDAARPFLRASEVERVIAATREHRAAVLAEPLADTLKLADDEGHIVRTLDREGLWRAQTPQGARRESLLKAFDAWDPAMRGLPTDESALLEAVGIAPKLVAAREPNPKITFPQDLDAAAALLATRA